MIPDFHTFREMLEHLETGGAAWRYGNSYPIYCKSSWGFGGIEKRYHAGSLGECVAGMGPCGGVDFSAEEQNSINWVFMPAEAWKQREEDMRAAWARIEDENRKRQKETGVFEGKVGQIVPTEKSSLWQRIFGKRVTQDKRAGEKE